MAPSSGSPLSARIPLTPCPSGRAQSNAFYPLVGTPLMAHVPGETRVSDAGRDAAIREYCMVIYISDDMKCSCNPIFCNFDKDPIVPGELSRAHPVSSGKLRARTPP